MKEPKYRRLNLRERVEIGMLAAQGLSRKEIGKRLGRSHTTISREFNKYSSCKAPSKYSPIVANDFAAARRRLAGRKPRLANPEIRQYVEDKLRTEKLSPELISGRLRVDLGLQVSHETIYQYIYNNDSPRDLADCLYKQHWMRRKRSFRPKAKKSRIPNRISIDTRPDEINRRLVVGHWEADSMVSKSCSAAVNAIVERKSRYVCLSKMPNKTAQATHDAIVSQLSQLPKEKVKSLTYDNGLENCQHERINQTLNTKSYFCEPYHSWEKGSVENAIGWVRRFIPKKTNLAHVTEEQLKQIEHFLNHRPKKCLGYQTPYEVFNSLSPPVR